MILSDQQIEFIDNNLKLYGVTSDALREDLLDHICTFIETNESQDFDCLYQEALQKFGGYANFQNLQRETHLQQHAKQIVMINKLKFSAGFVVILLLVTSLVFQMMQWPYANAWLLGAILISFLVILPIHFYARYKKSIHKFS
ncbi:hypothetical protein [Psychroserpens sp. SPM9]|uniref:hypothetical protein n=1 Tax=Psychroserpens sp. SPM9 TaxID=2975598 RepID=UPI0021A3462A|nr:hypothetical protein [Psychroserpens sp. SPM9]MDG5490924.1 hypothetical protein [Psychroserpens sp. SPM9]